jgi:hypothetical protein
MKRAREGGWPASSTRSRAHALAFVFAALMFAAGCGTSAVASLYSCRTDGAGPLSWCEGDEIVRCEPGYDGTKRITRTTCDGVRPRCQELDTTQEKGTTCQAPDVATACKAIALDFWVDDLHVLDLNGDGRSDIVGTHENTILVALRDPDGTFRSLPGVAGHVDAVGDFDGDGLQDLASSGWGLSAPPIPTVIEIRKGRGDGTFGAPSKMPLPRILTELFTIDVNGDRIDDLIAYEYESGDIQVLLGAKSGLEALPPQAGPSGRGRPADFNGDGMQDLLGGGLWLGGKDGGFTQGPRYDGRARIPVDLDDDGRTDVVGVDMDAHAITYARAREDGSFDDVVSLISTAPYVADSVLVLPADVTGDGVIDLVVSVPDSRILMISVGSATGAFASPRFYQPTLEPQVSSYGTLTQFDGTSAMAALDPPGPGGRDILLAGGYHKLLVFPASCR